jgi:dihydroorotate dehydrogenase
MTKNSKPYQIGSIKFEHPILNASGCWVTTEEQINELKNSNLSGIISKTCSIFSKKGNHEPNYYKLENENIHFNSKGLPNLGYSYYKDISDKFDTKPFIISITYDTTDNMGAILKDYDASITEPKLVEINMSCPNVETKIPGYHIGMIEKLIVNLFKLNLKNIEIGIKLPPYFEIDMMNKVVDCLNYTWFDRVSLIKYVVLSNSIPNAFPLLNGSPVLSSFYGGLSGKINKYIAISNVHIFSQRINKNIKIIGCGGIETDEDIFDYLKCGADFVQLGSCFYEENTNSLNIEKINNTINFFREKNKV